MGLASINIRFAVDLRGLSTQMQTAQREMAGVAASFKATAAKFNEAGSTLTQYVSLPILGIGVAALKSFGDLEALQKGLISVMGSSVAASAEFEKLKEVAKLPGLGLEEAVRGSVNLQAAGFSADQARESLLAFGNALATVGKGKAELDRVILALTQLNNKSTGFGQDLRQLTEQLPQLRGALTRAFGTSDSEAIAKTGVTGKEVVGMLTKEFAKLPKVTGGFNNALENATDAAKIAAASLGEALNKAFDVEGKVNRVSAAVAGAVETFKKWSPEAQKLALTIAGVAAAIGPVLLGIAGIAKIFSVAATGIALGLQLLGNSFLFLGRAIAFAQANAILVTGALLAAYAIYKSFASQTKELTAFQQEQNRVATLGNRVSQDAIKLIVDKKAKLNQLLAVARDETAAENERRAAIAEINKISPEYLGNLTLETINTEAATGAIEKYNVALLKAAKARAAQGLLEEFYKKQIEAQGEALKNDAKLEQERAKRALLSGDTRTKVEGQIQDNINKTTGVRATANKKIQDLSKKEEQFLLNIINGNKEYLDLLNDVTGASENAGVPDGVKAGTIKYYEGLIEAAQKLQKENTTSAAQYDTLQLKIDGFQKKINAINGTRVKVKTVFEIAQDNGFKIDGLKDTEMQGTPEAYDKIIEKLRQLQDMVSATSPYFLTLEEKIANLELEKSIKFDLDVDATGIEKAGDLVGTFGKKIKEGSELFHASLVSMKTVAAEFSATMSKTFESFKEEILVNFADGIANIINGGANIGTLFSGLITVVGDFLQQIGKALIQSAIVAEAFKNILALGAVALPIGVAAVILGGVIKNSAKNFAGSFADGGIVGGSSFSGDRLWARVNSGEMILNAQHQRNLESMFSGSARGGEMSLNIGGSFEVDGTKLRLVLDRTDKLNRRIN